MRDEVASQFGANMDFIKSLSKLPFRRRDSLRTYAQTVWFVGKPNHRHGNESTARMPALNIVVQAELVRVRTETERVDFALPFVVDPRADHVLREDVAAEEKLVIAFEVHERFVERARRLRNFGEFFRGKIVDVFVERRAGMVFVLNAVDHGHQQRREREIRIAARIGAAELDPCGGGGCGPVVSAGSCAGLVATMDCVVEPGNVCLSCEGAGMSEQVCGPA